MELIIKGVFEIETKDGSRVSPKIIELLLEIEQTGSLNAAVKNLGMSYSYAWNLLFKTNCLLEKPLVITRKGGNGGGLAELTEHGRRLLQQHKKLEQDFTSFIGSHKIDI